MDAHVLLADSAQTDPTGKLHTLGLGWNETRAFVDSMAIAVVVEFDVAEAIGEHTILVTLVDDQDVPLRLDGPETFSMQPHIKSTFTISTVDDRQHGMPVRKHVAINLPRGLPLEPDRVYAWQATIDGHTDKRWQARFFVRSHDETDHQNHAERPRLLLSPDSD